MRFSGFGCWERRRFRCSLPWWQIYCIVGMSSVRCAGRGPREMQEVSMSRLNKYLAATFLSPFRVVVLRMMRQRASGLLLAALVLAIWAAPAHAQNKTACELLSKA